MFDPKDASPSDDTAQLRALDAFAADAAGFVMRPEPVRRIVRDWSTASGCYQANLLDALVADAAPKPNRWLRLKQLSTEHDG